MRIVKVDIPKSDNINDGLDHIYMEKLSKVVLLAGANGSGKTRILNKVMSTFSNKPKQSELITIDQNLKEHLEAITTYEKQLTLQNTNLVSAPSQDKDQISSHIAQIEKTIFSLKKGYQQYLDKKLWKQIGTSEESDNYLAVPFVPKKLELQDPNNFSKNQIIHLATQIHNVGMNNLEQTALAKIQLVYDRWFSSTHPQSLLLDEEKKEAISNYERLTDIIQKVLNTSLGMTKNNELTLFGLPMGKSHLSDGQKILLQFALAIYSQNVSLKDLILILDEPENHLHPSVLIEMIDRISECVTNGQIWIATHSIALLAHFDPSCIWYLENGKINFAGKIPEKVLEGLLGKEENTSKLQDFINLPSQYATTRFAFESLFEPQAVETSANDPQSYQIRKDLIELAGGAKLRLLDFGAGKGRILSNLITLDQANYESLISQLDYIAFDKFPSDKEDCELALKKIYPDYSQRYFNEYSQLLNVYDKESFDVVIMCNVLHEIDPKEWINLFKTDGHITSLLKNNGILLLIEDYLMPIGEKAHQKGFLVLDTPQLKELFKIKEGDTDFSIEDSKGNGRIKTHKIPRRLLSQIDSTSRSNAIKALANMAKEKILTTRAVEPNYRNGRIHGFWTQQFANAKLALDEFES